MVLKTLAWSQFYCFHWLFQGLLSIFQQMVCRAGSRIINATCCFQCFYSELTVWTKQSFLFLESSLLCLRMSHEPRSGLGDSSPPLVSVKVNLMWNSLHFGHWACTVSAVLPCDTSGLFDIICLNSNSIYKVRKQSYNILTNVQNKLSKLFSPPSWLRRCLLIETSATFNEPCGIFSFAVFIDVCLL